MARPKEILFNEETAGANFAEFSVTKKPDGKIKMQKFLFILLYSAFSAVYIFVALILTKMAALIAILPLLLFILWLVTWRFTKIDFMYFVCQGQFHVYRVNGFNHAREVFCAKISENDGIYPEVDADYAAFAASCEHELDFSIGKGTADRYFARFSVDGKMTAVYFTAATKLLSCLRYYGGEKVIVTYVSR